ncbi:MAG TPA: hypothetical protein VMV56_08160 [Williamwhitmania sp.]|nr:hypothetical protein [Williamwhitmania sp.]
MKLTTEDVRTIKYEKRLGYLFAAFLLALGGIANLYYLVTNENTEINTLLLMDLLVVGLCVLVPYAMNYKYSRDIKLGIKTIKTVVVLSKEESIDYEAGSGTLYIPVLGALFPKIWGQEMKQVVKYMLNIADYKYGVTKEIYDGVSEGDEIEMHYTACSEMFLGFKEKS